MKQAIGGDKLAAFCEVALCHLRTKLAPPSLRGNSLLPPNFFYSREWAVSEWYCVAIARNPLYLLLLARDGALKRGEGVPSRAAERHFSGGVCLLPSQPVQQRLPVVVGEHQIVLGEKERFRILQQGFCLFIFRVLLQTLQGFLPV